MSDFLVASMPVPRAANPSSSTSTATSSARTTGSIRASQPGRLVEQRYEDIIPPLTDSCWEAVAASGVSPEEIRAVAFSSQAPLLALVDAEGNLIRDFLSWQDLRGAPYIPKLREAYGAERFYLETGTRSGRTAPPRSGRGCATTNPRTGRAPNGSSPSRSSS